MIETYVYEDGEEVTIYSCRHRRTTEGPCHICHDQEDEDQ